MSDANEVSDVIDANEVSDNDRWVTDILNQIAEITGVDPELLTRAEIRPNELEVTRLVSVQQPDGEEITIRVVSTIPWKWVPGGVSEA